MVWSAGALPKRRRIVHAVRNLAMLPGPPALWLGEWVAGPIVTIGVDDISLWHYTPGLLIKRVSFLGSLQWPVGTMDLGVGGICYVELLILYELWAGERLTLRRLTLGICGQDAQFQCRLFLLVQALIFGARVVLLEL